MSKLALEKLQAKLGSKVLEAHSHLGDDTAIVSADAWHEAAKLLRDDSALDFDLFVDLCAVDMEANPAACEASVEKSLAMVTSLNPYVGYEKAAAMAKEAFKSGKTIRQLCQQQQILPEETLNDALDPWSMTEPH